ncbi:MAG: LytTR family DNA-binding domain-containing protein [Caulobacteraceae bacterium]
MAFVYWLTCMTVLEPGNVAGALDAGIHLRWGVEAARLIGAGVLGAAFTPLVLKLASHFPVKGWPDWRRAILLGLGIGALALAMIVVSCVLAGLVLRGDAALALADVQRELFANGLLVSLCLCGFLAIVQAARRLAGVGPMEEAGASSKPAESQWQAFLPIKERGRLTMLPLSSVDWIETQGNYQALHAGSAVHLIRETSARLIARLDPSRFVRIHRRTVVALDRVRQVEALPNGDGVVRLACGAELRLARGYRERLRGQLERAISIA